jgi:hypothetical protein
VYVCADRWIRKQIAALIWLKVRRSARILSKGRHGLALAEVTYIDNATRIDWASWVKVRMGRLAFEKPGGKSTRRGERRKASPIICHERQL